MLSKGFFPKMSIDGQNYFLIVNVVGKKRVVRYRLHHIPIISYNHYIMIVWYIFCKNFFFAKFKNFLTSIQFYKLTRSSILRAHSVISDNTWA